MGGGRQSNPMAAKPPAGCAERRSVCRYSVVLEGAWLGWWEGEAFQSTSARIVDLSLRGARLVVESFPPRDRSVWFSPTGIGTQDEWIEAKLLDAKKRLFGPREVRVVFRKLFPYEIFKNVVYGPDSFSTPPPPKWLPMDAEERDWW